MALKTKLTTPNLPLTNILKLCSEEADLSSQKDTQPCIPKTAPRQQAEVIFYSPEPFLNRDLCSGELNNAFDVSEISTGSASTPCYIAAGVTSLVFVELHKYNPLHDCGCLASFKFCFQYLLLLLFTICKSNKNWRRDAKDKMVGSFHPRGAGEGAAGWRPDAAGLFNSTPSHFPPKSNYVVLSHSHWSCTIF
jgi:hypothetical protein